MTTAPTQNTSLRNIPTIPDKRTWRQTFSNALIITRREVRDSFRDWRILVPIILLTFFFPFLAQNVASSFNNFLADFGANLIGERSIPFLLMVVGFFPISISLVIALETFVGEKERRSLEPLLSTPLTNTELYIGKTLAAMIPPLLASFGGMVFYLTMLVGSDLAWRPAPMLIVQIFVLTIIQALVMVTGAVVVSSQTTSTRAANLLASFIIIPMALVINGESIIMFLAPDADSPFGIGALWAIAVGMAIVVVLFLRVGNTIFNREELLGRAIDSIKLSATFKRLWQHFIAVDADGTPARNLFDWYRRGIPYAFQGMRKPIALTFAVFMIAFVAGFGVGMLPQFQLQLPPQTALESVDTTQLLDVLTPSLRQQAMFSIFDQNMRVIFLTLLLSVFSFGVASYIILPITLAVLGYIFGQMLISGWDMTLYWGAILPHGVLELPLLLIVAAVMFRIGAIVTRPPHNWTVGQAWLITFAKTLRILIGLVIPGFLLTAFIEVTITPVLVLNLL
jgi:uncharacterized membrane protein SpoIIM required for sporulation